MSTKGSPTFPCVRDVGGYHGGEVDTEVKYWGVRILGIQRGRKRPIALLYGGNKAMMDR